MAIKNKTKNKTKTVITKIKKINLKFWIIATVIFITDWITKTIIKNNIETGTTKQITTFFSITNITNTGTAFGLLKNFQWIFIILTTAIITYIILKHKTFGKTAQIPLALILGGAFGNLYDRIFYGAVTDFISFKFWPAFNIADSAITIGIILLLYTELKQK